MDDKRTTILFFIGSLTSGGKERRLLELLTYLGGKGSYRLILLTKKTEILFDNFEKLQIEWVQMEDGRISLRTFKDFYKIAKSYQPAIIHTWGSNLNLIALPYRLFNRRVRLVNSQITSAPPRLSFSEKLISRFNFRFSDVILSNSFAGLRAYNPPVFKSQVIYNGLNFNRFSNLRDKHEVKKEYGLDRKYTIIMVASYSSNKDYLRFFRVGIELTKLRHDFAFLGVGFFKGGEDIFEECERMTASFDNLMPVPGRSHIESLVNVCDIGVLFSNKAVHGEGISNSLIEYMALGKPVIANDAGGTKEIVIHGENGYLVDKESDSEIARMIDSLLNDREKLEEMGRKSKERIYKDFSLDRMGREFAEVYRKTIGATKA